MAFKPIKAKTSDYSRGVAASSLVGANEDMFLQAFDSTPKLDFTTQKRFELELARVVQTISNPRAEWDDRVQAMRHFRSLVNSGIATTDYFYTNTLKSLEIPFQSNISDLRSQVVRETCITIAFLSCRLQQKFSRMAETLLPSLIKLIPNSAKIISTSALVALRFIIQSTHNSKFIPLIKYQLSTSKSKDIHRALCEIAERICTLWPTNIIERQLSDLQEILKLGICDSDEKAREHARRAFNVFAEHFREQADRLFNTLDPQRQRMLTNLSHGGGSTLSINGHDESAYHSARDAHQQQQNTSSNLISRLKDSLPATRSASAIDVSAQKRARARAVYMYPRRIGPPGSINSPKSSIPTPVTPATPPTPASVAYVPTSTTPVSTTPAPTIPAPPTPLPTTATPAQATPEALSKAASYLMLVINNRTIDESQIVSTIKYFNTLIDKNPISECLHEIMPPLVIGIDHSAISVRKASVFALVAIHTKVGMNAMEPYLTSLTMTQRKLLEVYIKKY